MLMLRPPVLGHTLLPSLLCHCWFSPIAPSYLRSRCRKKALRFLSKLSSSELLVEGRGGRQRWWEGRGRDVLLEAHQPGVGVSCSAASFGHLSLGEPLSNDTAWRWLTTVSYTLDPLPALTVSWASSSSPPVFNSFFFFFPSFSCPVDTLMRFMRSNIEGFANFAKTSGRGCLEFQLINSTEVLSSDTRW